MIDIENIVFNTVKTAVLTSYPSATVSSTEIDVPASFPCVTVVESDNVTYDKTLDGSNAEHHAKVTYTINIYSNKKDSKKSQAKAILKIVDEQMLGKRFVRNYCGNTPNVDSSIYRITARYSAIVSEGETTTVGEDTTTTYRMFRK